MANGKRSLKHECGALIEDPVGLHVCMTFQRRDLLGTIAAVDNRGGYDWLTVRHFDGSYWPVSPHSGEVSVIE